MNLNMLDWDQDFWTSLKSKVDLPSIRDTSEIYGYTDPSLFGREITLAAAAGDQQSALFGQELLQACYGKEYLWEGCFMLMYIGQSQRFKEYACLQALHGEHTIKSIMH